MSYTIRIYDYICIKISISIVFRVAHAYVRLDAHKKHIRSLGFPKHLTPTNMMPHLFGGSNLAKKYIGVSPNSSVILSLHLHKFHTLSWKLIFKVPIFHCFQKTSLCFPAVIVNFQLFNSAGGVTNLKWHQVLRCK